MILLIVLLLILTECKQENVPGQGPLNSRENNSSNEGTIAMTLEEGVISVPPQSPTPAARTVSFLTDHQLELGIGLFKQLGLSIKSHCSGRCKDQSLTGGRGGITQGVSSEFFESFLLIYSHNTHWANFEFFQTLLTTLIKTCSQGNFRN